MQGSSIASNYKEPIKCVSLTNRPCQGRLVNVNFDKTFFYPFIVNVNKCGGNCNTIDDPYARGHVPEKVKNINAKVFNLMLGVNETRLLVQSQSCECKYRLSKSVCSSKQKCNQDECRCECRKLDD